MLTDDELKAVRERDAEWVEQHGMMLPTTTGAINFDAGRVLLDRRALLRHIDALTEKLAALRDPETVAALRRVIDECDGMTPIFAEHPVFGNSARFNEYKSDVERLRALLPAAIDAAKDRKETP